MSERLKDFIIVDATQPQDKVYEEVLSHILIFAKTL
jgi:hypothetical protein